MGRPREHYFEGSATDLAAQSRRHGRASRSKPQRVRSTARCTALTGESPPRPNRRVEPGSEIDTAWPDDWTFLLPRWRGLHSPATGPAALRTADNEPSRPAKDYCAETSVARRGSASRTQSGSARIRSVLMRRGDFRPNDEQPPTTIRRAPYRRDRLFSRPLPCFEERYRAQH